MDGEILRDHSRGETFHIRWPVRAAQPVRLGQRVAGVRRLPHVHVAHRRLPSKCQQPARRV